MIRKLSCFSVLLIVIGGLTIGCSDDSSRVTSPEEEILLGNQLSTDAELPGTATDLSDYISDGFYYPEDDTSVDDGPGQYTYDDPDDDPSDKPIDNNLNVN